jgi:hypothetical protein
MDIYAQIVEKIIKSQETIIGPVAIEQAQQVDNLQVDWPKHKITIGGDEAKVIDQLIAKYKDLFGQISVEVSKEAVGSLISQLPSGGLPETLK